MPGGQQNDGLREEEEEEGEEEGDLLASGPVHRWRPRSTASLASIQITVPHPVQKR